MTRRTAAARGTSVTLAEAAEHWPAIERIFFLTAGGLAADATAAARRAHLARWTGYYRDEAPADTHIRITDDGTVVGYLMGCSDSRAAGRLYRDIPYYAAFENLFDTFPAHFHVNCHPDHQGRGHGTALVVAFVDAMRRGGTAGIHVVTSAEAGNAGFYRACGFSLLRETRWRGRTLLCLGRETGAT